MSKIKLQSEYSDLDKYEYHDGDIIYYKKDTDIVHNPYGPAVIYSNGMVSYCINNKIHRLDGPARIYPNGKGEYYINGKNKGDSKQEFYNNIKNLNTETINKQDKINVLNIKNSIILGLDNNIINILKSLL